MNDGLITNKQYNIGYICTSKQCEAGRADKIALRYISSTMEKNDITFNQLNLLSNKFANVLKYFEYKHGDIFFIFLPKSIELFSAFLGILKMQVIAGSLFANIGDETLFDRLFDSNAKGIITKKSFLKKLLPIRSKLPSLKHIFITDIDENQDNEIYSYKMLIKESSDSFIPEITHADCPSVLHYTSGSTGKPKGVLHVHGGIVYQNRTINEIFQIKEEDKFWCTADQGWITGTTYGISAPWSNGVTQIHFAGVYNPEIWFNIIQNEKINIWYTAPTALRMIMREEPEFFKNFNLTELKHIFSVGEPLNPEIIYWAKRTFNKVIYDTWFQTETGAVMISNRPGMEIKPGSMGKPVDSIKAEIIDDNGISANKNEHGNLCLESGWESMFTTYLNNPEIYKSKFKKGYYYSGDKCYKDENGYFWFVGRSDDVINTAGHLVGPFEVESVLLEIEEIAEAAVIGAADEILFEKIVAYICLKKKFSPSPELELKIRLYVTNKISSTATPQEIIFTDNIPKNKSGKIMRRVLKAKYLGNDVGDISTMEV